MAESNYTHGLAQIKTLFFDRAKVLDAADRATQKVLSRFGAFVRARARSSIRKRKRISDPGSPPSSHVGTLRDSIFFAFDPARRSVVIGPVRAGDSGGMGALALEEGGPTRLAGIHRGRSAHIRARPYMQPAFQAELPSVPSKFKGQFK